MSCHRTTCRLVNPSVIFKRKCHLPLHKGGLFLSCHKKTRTDLGTSKAHFSLRGTPRTPPSPFICYFLMTYLSDTKPSTFRLIFSLTRKYIILLWSISYRQRRYIIPIPFGISFSRVSFPCSPRQLPLLLYLLFRLPSIHHPNPRAWTPLRNTL